MKYAPPLIVDLVVLIFAAFFAGAAGILVWTWDMELIGAGLLVVLWNLPAVVGMTLAHHLARPRLAHLLFWILFLPMPALLIAAALPTPIAAPPEEGTDQLALALLIPTLAAGLISYLLSQTILRPRPHKVTDHSGEQST